MRPDRPASPRGAAPGVLLAASLLLLACVCGAAWSRAGLDLDPPGNVDPQTLDRSSRRSPQPLAGTLVGSVPRRPPQRRRQVPRYLGRVVVEDHLGRRRSRESGRLVLERAGARSGRWVVPVRRGAFSVELPVGGRLVPVRAELGGRDVCLRSAELFPGEPVLLVGVWEDVLVVHVRAAEDDHALRAVELRAGEAAGELLAAGPSPVRLARERVGPGPLWIAAPGRPVRRVAHLPPGDRLELRLPLASSVEVRLVGIGSRDVVVRCGRVRARPDAGGRARLEGLSPGPRVVVVERRGREVARAHLQLTPGERRIHAFSIERPGRIVGLVRGVRRDLDPLRVRLEPRAGSGTAPVVVAEPVRAGVRRFAFEDAAPGDYRLVVEGVLARPLRLVPGGEARVELTAPRTMERVLELVEDDGRRAGVERVEWWPAGAPADPPARAACEGPGRFRLRAPDGDVVVRTGDGRCVRVAFSAGVLSVRARLP